MYKKLRIKNFRAFQEFTIEPLERVNLVLGKNNVGKTALLEALFLLLGTNNPELSLRINIFRGLDRFPTRPEEVWGWLFYDRRVHDEVMIEAMDEKKASRRLTIRLGSTEVIQRLPVGNEVGAARRASQAAMTGSGLGQLSLAYKDPKGNKAEGHATFSADGNLAIKRGPVRPPVPLAIFLSSHTRFPGEDAERFSALEKRGAQEQLLPTLRTVEPKLKRLAVLSVAGAPIIHADVGLSELLPLPLLGDGFVRLLSILLAIANVPGGFALVDEIENGLHYSVLRGGFEAIAEAARRFDVQVVATTHSWECVRAAHEAFSGFLESGFCLHRLERTNGAVRDVVYDLPQLGLAISNGLEVR